MAISVATELTAFGFTTPTGPSPNSTISAAENETLSCFVTMQFDAQTYAQADDATFNPATVIESAQRNGKTVTVLGAAFVSAAQAADGTIVGGGVVSDITSNVVTMPLTLEDLTSEFTDATLVPAFDRPLCMLVTYHQLIE